MPPGEAQEIGEKVISDDNHDEDPDNIPPTAIEGEFRDITKQEGSDV